jgi:hypothetical protein
MPYKLFLIKNKKMKIGAKFGGANAAQKSAAQKKAAQI